MNTLNPAYPHPDQEPDDVPPMELDDSIIWALKVLRDPTADMWLRRKAADELQYSFECLES